MSFKPRCSPALANGTVYENRCVIPGAGLSCVKDAAHAPPRPRVQVKMFCTMFRSWLKASSTRNELSVISHLPDGSDGGVAGAGCAAAELAHISSVPSRMVTKNNRGRSAMIDLNEQFRCCPRTDRQLVVVSAQSN